MVPHLAGTPSQPSLFNEWDWAVMYTSLQAKQELILLVCTFLACIFLRILFCFVRDGRSRRSLSSAVSSIPNMFRKSTGRSVKWSTTAIVANCFLLREGKGIGLLGGVRLVTIEEQFFVFFFFLIRMVLVSCLEDGGGRARGGGVASGALLSL